MFVSKRSSMRENGLFCYFPLVGDYSKIVSRKGAPTPNELVVRSNSSPRLMTDFCGLCGLALRWWRTKIEDLSKCLRTCPSVSLGIFLGCFEKGRTREHVFRPAWVVTCVK